MPRTARHWRGSCGPGRTACCRTRRPRSWSGLCSTSSRRTSARNGSTCRRPRAELLPGDGPGLDRGARGHPRRRATPDRRRLPEPDRRIEGVTTHLLNADPTVFYAIDTLDLDELPFDNWQEYSFWNPPGVPLAEVALPEALQGFQTYQTPGLDPVAASARRACPRSTRRWSPIPTMPTSTSWRSRTVMARTPSPRPRRSTTRTARKYGYIQ